MPGFGRSGRPGKPLAIAVGAILLFIVGWVVVSRVAANLNDHSESFYPSLAEAGKDGAITRGWIPDVFLPRTSRSIHEVHYLSPSTEWCAFEFVPTDSQNLRTNLKLVDVLPQSVGPVPSPRVSWWPSVLVGNLDVQKIHKAGFDLYFVERPATSVASAVWLFAIDWSHGRGFFYGK
ncbi:MAG: hypothetical protein WCA20_29620 [Candidatus Sulfotelmatobacter sp.]